MAWRRKEAHGGGIFFLYLNINIVQTRSQNVASPWERVEIVDLLIYVMCVACRSSVCISHPTILPPPSWASIHLSCCVLYAAEWIAWETQDEPDESQCVVYMRIVNYLAFPSLLLNLKTHSVHRKLLLFPIPYTWIT